MKIPSLKHPISRFLIKKKILIDFNTGSLCWNFEDSTDTLVRWGHNLAMGSPATCAALSTEYIRDVNVYFTKIPKRVISSSTPAALEKNKYYDEIGSHPRNIVNWDSIEDQSAFRKRQYPWKQISQKSTRIVKLP
ncbi:unnamed protein product [Xylocopa violacea]|uniref:Uncharacterized protein n=1 Tax=Xylocopa violacea TaxID=135666 RepID=A0ABP1NQ31_XYLVO